MARPPIPRDRGRKAFARSQMSPSGARPSRILVRKKPSIASVRRRKSPHRSRLALNIPAPPLEVGHPRDETGRDGLGRRRSGDGAEPPSNTGYLLGVSLDESQSAS
jgi:hypothetical protein